MLPPKSCEQCGASFVPHYAKRRFCSTACYNNFRENDESAFWNIVQVAGPDDCWEWPRATCFGYGMFRFRREQRKTHRVAWEITFGAIPDAMWVLHKCDNPPCCNPNHLFLGTLEANVADMVTKGRQAKGERNGHHTKPERTARGERNGKAIMTEDSVRQARGLYARGGYTQKQLAAMFGVTRWTMQQVLSRRAWGHID